MKKQALFSLKDKSKNLKCRLLQFLFGILRVKHHFKSSCPSGPGCSRKILRPDYICLGHSFKMPEGHKFYF